MEHRRSKVTWARLCSRVLVLGVCTAECSGRAYARPSARVERMHGRVLGSGVCTTECSGVYTAECSGVCLAECSGDRVRVSGVCMTECMSECLGICTVECACRAHAWPSARVCARPSARVGCLHGRVLGCLGVCTAECACRARGAAVRDDGLDERAARRFVRPRLGYSFCTTRMGARLGLVVVHDLVGTRPRFGRDARIGCTRAKLLGMIEPCG